MIYRATSGASSLLGIMMEEDEKIGIVVLGGGVDSDGHVYPHTELRIAKAIDVYNKYTASSSGKKVVSLLPLSGGTPHKPPPKDDAGFPIAEATAAARVMINKYNIPPNVIREEPYSVDTLGNSYFLRTLLAEPGGYHKLIIITNDWHMPRVKSMFTYTFSLPNGSNLSNDVKLEFIAVDAGLPEETLQVRKDREKASLYTFESIVKHKFTTLQMMSEFLFTQHEAYASSRLLHTRKPIDKNVLKTY